MDDSSADIHIDETLSLASRLLGLEETVARADRARSAKTMMLDVRQPLSVMMIDCGTGLKYLCEARPNLGKVHAILERLLASAERADAIVQEYDDSVVSHFPRCETLSLEKLARLAIQRIQHQLISCGLTFERELPPVELNVFGDRTQLVQALVNLLMFAITRADRDGGLRLEILSKEGMQVVRLEWHASTSRQREIQFGNDCRMKELDADISVSNAIAEAHGGCLLVEDGTLEMWLPPRKCIVEATASTVMKTDPTKEN